MLVPDQRCALRAAITECDAVGHVQLVMVLALGHCCLTVTGLEVLTGLCPAALLRLLLSA